MTYEKLTELVKYQRSMQEAELDVLTVTSSFKGFGKSTFIIQNARKYMELFGLFCQSCNHEWVYTGQAMVKKAGRMQIKSNLFQPCPKCNSNNITKVKDINFSLYLCYDNDEVWEKIHDLPPFSPILPDEGVRFMMGEDWNLSENKQMKKLFAQCRTKRYLIKTNIPKFRWLDSKYRNDMTTFWVRILKRGIAILCQPDMGETTDPWHMDLFEKLLGSYNYFTPESELIKKAQLLKNKHPCVFDYFHIPKLPDDIYKRYQKARDAKVFERRSREVELDQKELSKIATYNLINHWEEIKGAIKSGRFDRPTLKILENSVFNNPITDEQTVRYTTLRNWNKEIAQIVRKKKGTA